MKDLGKKRMLAPAMRGVAKAMMGAEVATKGNQVRMPAGRVLHVRGTLSILGLGFVLRGGVALLCFAGHPRTWLYTRAPELAALASSLAQGRGLCSPFGGDTGPTAFLAPGYPALIALIFRIFGVSSFASVIAILAMQTGFGTLTVWAMMRTARALFGEAEARVAGVAGAVGLTLLFVPAIFWETSLSTLMLTGMVAMALDCERRPTGMRWAAMGVCGGAAMLVNPALAPVMLAILAWTAWQTRSGSFRWPVVGFLLMVIVFAPWPIRNARVLHSFIPFRSNFGFELWMGNKDGGRGDFDESLFPIENKREHAAYVSEGEVAYMDGKLALAEAHIRAHPAEFVCTSARRVVWFWFGTGGQSDAWVGVLHAIVTTVLGCFGLMLLAWLQRAKAMLVALPLALFPLPYYLTHADLRFRLVLDPLLIVLAAHALVRADLFLKSRDREASAAAAVAPQP